MPSLDSTLNSDLRMRIMLYGPPKTKKTWWAGTAAEAGFNVLLLDGEQGAGILRQLSPAARKRIYRLDVQDLPGRAIMAEFMTYFLKYPKFNWDETAKKFSTGKPQAESTIVLDRAQLLNENTVVVVDSYSALVWSVVVRYCVENQIDLSDASKQEWEGYRWSGALLTWMVRSLVQLPCHVILLGHQEMYEKRKENKVEWSRLQMKSASGPHAMTIANNFDDVLYSSVAGSSFYIDARADKDRDGGARFVEPKRYDWNELSIAALCKMGGIPLPPADLPLIGDIIQQIKTDAIVSYDKPTGPQLGPRSPANQIEAGKGSAVVAPVRSVKLGVGGLLKK